MKKLTFIAVGFILIAGIFILWRSGILNSIEAVGSFLVALFLGTHVKHKQDIEQAKHETQEAIRRIKQQEAEIKAQRGIHDREVREVEESYSDATFDELLAGANERERKRKTGNLGE